MKKTDGVETQILTQFIARMIAKLWDKLNTLELSEIINLYTAILASLELIK